MYKFWYRMFVLVIMVLLLGIGTIIGYNVTNNGIIEDEYVASPINTDSKKNIQIYDEIDGVESVSTKKYNVEVVYIDEYLLCKESITDSQIHYDVDLDELKNKEVIKQKEEGKKYELVEESNERLVFKRVEETYCPNHYKVVLEDKKINVYRVITKDKNELYKNLDIPIETLRTEVIDELTGGILVNSEAELKMIVEDIES